MGKGEKEGSGQVGRRGKVGNGKVGKGKIGRETGRLRGKEEG